MSSQGFTKGPVCGVDNCPSRLWRRVDGQKVCQYGHVNVADLEINDDEDQMASAMQSGVTRRLTNVAGLSQNRTSEAYISQRQIEEQDNHGRIYGEELKKLIIECLQIILNVQCDWIINEIGAPPIIKKHARMMWVKYLLNNNVEHLQETNEAVPSYTSFPTMRLITNILYLSCLKLRLPIYVSDFNSWIATNALPFQKAHHYLPLEIRERFAQGAVTTFDTTPDFYNESVKLLNILGEEERDKIIPKVFNYFPLLVRLALRMRLPLEVLIITKNLIDQTELDLSYPRFYSYLHRYGEFKLTPAGGFHPELKIAGILQSSAKIFFRKNKKLYTKWVCLINTYRKDIDSNFDKSDLARFIHSETKMENITNWDQNSTDTYLDWMAKDFMPMIAKKEDLLLTEQKQVTFKRLNEIFPLDTTTTESIGDSSMDNAKLQLIGIYNELYDNDDFDKKGGSNSYNVDTNECYSMIEDIFFDYYRVAFDVNSRLFHKIVVWADRFCNSIEELLETDEVGG